MSYPITVDKEVVVGDKVYSVYLDADLDYSDQDDPEPTEVVITKAEIAEIRGEEVFPLPVGYSGRAIEKVVLEGLTTLTDHIDNELWDEIQRHKEDNCSDIARDLRGAYDERDL